jgi:hypothetical protein
MIIIILTEETVDDTLRILIKKIFFVYVGRIFLKQTTELSCSFWNDSKMKLSMNEMILENFNGSFFH